jgi:hypothetical protein
MLVKPDRLPARLIGCLVGAQLPPTAFDQKHIAKRAPTTLNAKWTRKRSDTTSFRSN